MYSPIKLYESASRYFTVLDPGFDIHPTLLKKQDQSRIRPKKGIRIQPTTKKPDSKN